jgi:hypothetical protein
MQIGQSNPVPPKSVPPVELQIVSAESQVDGLLLKAEITSKKTFQSSALRIEGKGMKSTGTEMGVISSKDILLSDQLGDIELREGDKKEFSLLLPGDGIEQYELSLLWGESKKDILSSTEEKVQRKTDQKEVSINDTNVETTVAPTPVTPQNLPEVLVLNPRICTAQDCENFQVEIINQTSNIIHGLVLVSGVIWNSDGNQVQPPEDFKPVRTNENEMDLSQIELLPTQKQEISIKLSKKLPKVSGGKFVPYVRIAKFQ